VRHEVITPGRLQGTGVRAAQDIADYVLTYRNHKLAVIEAKRRDLADTEGLGQAKKYAEKLQTRFAYSTNGAGIYQVDMTTDAEQYVSQYRAKLFMDIIDQSEKSLVFCATQDHARAVRDARNLRNIG